MSRRCNLEKSAILDQAMHFFWENGFDGASIDALVKAIGTSRFSLYQMFGGKDGLFLASLEHYSQVVVGQALAILQAGTKGREGIANYFEHLIGAAQKADCLSRGCLMTNAMIEFGNQPSDIATSTQKHFQRIVEAMAKAIGGSKSTQHSKAEISNLALFIATFSQGLWLRARAGEDAKTLLKAYKTALLIL